MAFSISSLFDLLSEGMRPSIELSVAMHTSQSLGSVEGGADEWVGWVVSTHQSMGESRDKGPADADAPGSLAPFLALADSEI